MLTAMIGHTQENGDYILAPYVTESDSLKVVSRAVYEVDIDLMRLDYSGKRREFLLEALADRRDYFREMIKDGNLITEGELYDYVQSIADRIVANNSLGSKRTIFLVKDESANAFNTGDDNVFIHLGLIYRLENEAELAYVIGHEIGHNEANHFLDRQADYAELSLNDSIKKARREIMRKDYGHVTALNKLMIPWLLENKEKSRACEEEADDFGYHSLNNSGYIPEHAIAVFDILENSEFEKDDSKFDFVQLLSLEEGKLDYTKPLRLRISSSLGFFEPEDKGEYEDLLRTHPFSDDRKDAFIARIMEDGGYSESEFVVDSNYFKYQEMAEHEMIISSINQGNIDRALFYALQKYKKDSSDVLVNRVIPFCFSYMGYEKKKGRSGRLIDMQDPDYDDNYNELLYFLMEISPDHCMEIAKLWIDKMPSELARRLDITNPTTAMFKIYEMDKEDFQLRAEREEDCYYLIPIFKIIKRENYIK